MALLLCVVNESENVVVNQVVEEVNLPIEVGFDICGTSPEPDYSDNQGKALDAFKPTLCFTNLYHFCF